MQRKLIRKLQPLERYLPMFVRRMLRRAFQRPLPVGGVRLGDLRSTVPVDPWFGYSRGQPLDRFYIEAFLAAHASDIHGAVLEIGDDEYTRCFGGDRVTNSSVFHVSADNPKATYVGDLAAASHVPSGHFDCVVLTQTLHLIYDFQSALSTLERILRPGGVLLLTVPGITPVDPGEWRSTWYWAFTEVAVNRMLAESFGTEPAVRSHGNVLVATGFLQGLATSELTPAELAAQDPAYPIVVTARVQKKPSNPA